MARIQEATRGKPIMKRTPWLGATVAAIALLTAGTTDAAAPALVKQFFHAVETRNKDLVLKIVREDYIQHMPGIPTGRAAILNYIDMVAPKGQGKEPEFRRVIAEGDLVVVQFRREDPNGPVAVVETFRIQGGQIAEHWAVTEAIPPEDKARNKNGMI
jgi:predicted SnoaL-like aldol condensation-catalyzing enzyme